MALHYAQERKDWGKPITDKATGIIKSLGLSEWAPTTKEATQALHLLHETGGVATAGIDGGDRFLAPMGMYADADGLNVVVLRERLQRRSA